MKSKSQIEIMGLVVIVIIIAIGFFSYLAFILNTEPVEPIVEYSQDQLAQTFLSSLVKTETYCDLSFDKVVQDCSLEQNLVCHGNTSCQVVNDTIEIILNKTLNTWGYAYNLTIENLNIEYLNKNCTAKSDRGTQGIELITLYGRGDVLLTLDMCR